MKNWLRDNDSQTPRKAREVRGFLGSAHGFLRDHRGGSAILFGLTLPVLIGFLGLSIETSMWYFEKRKLQEVADTAALAGALEIATDPTALYKDAAVRAAVQSGFINLDPNAVVSPPNTGLFTTDTQAVEAIVVRPYQTHFVSLFGIESVDIATRAVATSNGTGPPIDTCITACAYNESTDPEICDNNSPGILIQGSTTINLIQCGMHSNDACDCSYDFNGNGTTVNASCMTHSGGIDNAPTCGSPPTGLNLPPDGICSEIYGPIDPLIGPNSPCGRLTVTEAVGVCDELALSLGAPTPNPTGFTMYDGCPQVPDITVPPHNYSLPTDCCTDSVPDDPLDPATLGIQCAASGEHKTFLPGWYPDDANSPNIGAMEVGSSNGDINIVETGLYCVGGGAVTADFHINGGSFDAGSGVTLVMMDPLSTFDFNGNGDMYWTAPGAGDFISPAFDPIAGDASRENQWEGVGLYLASTVGVGDSNPCANKINGTGVLEFGGEILGPETCLTFTGNNTSSGNVDDPCFRLTVGNLTLSGNLDLSSTGCADYGADTAGVGLLTAIVE